jgi:hypothetical protein
MDFEFPTFDVPEFSIPQSAPLADVISLRDYHAANHHERIERDRRAKEASSAESIELGRQAEDPQGYFQTDLSSLPAIDEWIEDNCYDFSKVNPITLDTSNSPKIILEPYQKEILRHIFPPGGYKNRLSKYTTIVWSQPKKSGKSGTAAFVACYMAENIDPPNNVLAVANKKDQAEGRIYRSMKPTVKALGGTVKTAVNSPPVMYLANGTQIRALPNSPATEAGDRYILTCWTEIWAFKSEDDERLFSELMPVETERISMRWIETYAGYWDESNTLKRIYMKAFKDSTERELQDGSDPQFSRARYVPELAHITTDNRPACIEVPEEELFIFWDHERRMPWQTHAAYVRDTKGLPKTEALRLMQNRWQSSSSEMLEEAWIEAACVTDMSLKQFEGRPLTFAVDAAMRHDSIAIVGSEKIGETYYTPFIEIHDPRGQDADLHELVENRIKSLFDEGLVKPFYDEKNEKWVSPVYFDPYQLHQIRLNCITHGIDVIEFSQGDWRTKADTMLFHLYKDGLVKIPPTRPDFEEHLRAGKAKFTEGEKVRIVKGTTTDAKRIDALVAQSMSCYGAFLCEQYDTRDDKSSVLLLGSAKNSWFE